MNLSDSDILELNELCSAVIEETLTDRQKARLSHWLATSEAARQFYVRMTGLSASLYHYAGEMQTGEPEGPGSGASKKIHRWRWMFGMLAVAASIALVIVLRPKHEPARPGPIAATTEAPPPPIAPTNENDLVARLTGCKQCEWGPGTTAIQLGARLRKGQQLELIKGFAEITFDSGAQVLLQGPASLDVNSAWSATLNRGTLKAALPPEAMGFSISNPTVEVVDLGTEFTMFADFGGTSTDVLVLKGEVEAAPRTPTGDQQPVVLREKDARRFAASGVSNLHNNDQKFEDLSQPVSLDRFSSPVGYAHWSFDEPSGTSFKAETFGLPSEAADSKVVNVSPPIGAIHTAGPRQGALRFDGSLYAKATFPGISENSAHTFAFWAKVPKEANLSSAYAMVAWAANSKQVGSHPFHIGWNRNPSEGIVGVLRTDYGRGYALGATPLRDGQWHHIAVVLIPRDNAESPMEVKQYVDGRLEGEGRPSPPGSDIFMSAENTHLTAAGAIWLGCRLGIKGVRADRFSGEMDELFIADRALEPQDIVRLMNTNRMDE